MFHFLVAGQLFALVTGFAAPLEGAEILTLREEAALGLDRPRYCVDVLRLAWATVQ